MLLSYTEFVIKVKLIEFSYLSVRHLRIYFCTFDKKLMPNFVKVVHLFKVQKLKHLEKWSIHLHCIEKPTCRRVLEFDKLGYVPQGDE